MPLQLDLKEQDLLTLEDAIAYEFFMESVAQIMNDSHKEDLDIAKAISKLATASYLIANIFCEARSINAEQLNDADA
jgi:hypothetical protein